MSADSLLGRTTPCGWEVYEKVESKQHSGGNFCTRYLVRNSTGTTAFLKAMDLSRAFQVNSANRLNEINKLTGEYLFERNILQICKDAKMTKVVVPLSAGEIIIAEQHPPLDEVYYIIFEKADGDLRQAFLNAPHSTWYSFFRAIKHTCIGLEQLHKAKIAHQDIKPSNILNFDNKVSKVADLGRVIDAEGQSPFSTYYFAGDLTYAPIEIIKNVHITEFEERFLADLYAVGSLIFQTFMGPQITAALKSEAALISPAVGQMNYEQALPIYTTTFFTLLDRMHQECSKRFDTEIADSVVNTVKEMCHPDYKTRGLPKSTNLAVRTSLRRYTGKINTILRLLKVKGYM